MAFRYKVDRQQVTGYQSNNLVEICAWCRDNVGDAHITWQFNINNWTWRFRFKRDYTLFLLRWA